MDEFSKQKLLWAETMRIHKSDITNFPRFSFTEKEIFTDKTCFFAVGKYLFFLLGYLNSSIGRYLCKRYVSILDNGGYLMQKVYLELIPIPLTTKNDIQEIENFCKKRLSDRDRKTENAINKKIYSVFNFTEEEINYIENDNLEALSR